MLRRYLNKMKETKNMKHFKNMKLFVFFCSLSFSITSWWIR